MNRMELQIDFHQQDEASLFVESNAPGQLREFGETLLFSCLALRQLHNLGRNPAASLLAGVLETIKADPRESLLQLSSDPDYPRIVEYRGSRGRRRFTGLLDYEADKASFKLYPKGFGFFMKGINYYAPHTVLLLLEFLARRNWTNDPYLDRLAEAGSVCVMVYRQGKVTSLTQTGLAVGIARHTFGYPI